MDKRFLILEQLGQGGHGKVYRARDEQLDRVVAIKVFHDSHPEGERLMKEARTLCRLTHPGIVNVYDVSRISITEGEQTTITLSEDGGAQDEQLVWAMIMEDLGDIDPLRYVQDHGDAEALRIAADIAEAMQAAHIRGIYHCDLNNNNVRIVRGQAKVFDFSLAARKTGRPYGTPAYRAPEQARGDEPSDRTDVYGLGRLLLALLRREQLGKVPDSGSFLPLINQFPRKSRISIETLLHHMLDVEPQKRPGMEHVAQVCRQLIRPQINRKSVLHTAGRVGLLFGVLTAIGLGESWLLRHEWRGAVASTDSFAVTIRLHNTANDPDLIKDAAGTKVLLDLGSDRRVATFDANGEAAIKEVPARFLGQRVTLQAQVPGYSLLTSQSNIVLSKDPIAVELSRDFAPVPARLRIAIGLVHHGKNVLMVRRRFKEGKLSWQFPAGIIKPLQDPDQRIVEEVQKETGISVKVLSKFGERISPDTKAHMVYFDCEYLAGKLQNGEANENAEVAWVPANEVGRYITSDIWVGVVDRLNGIKNGNAD